MVAGVEVTMTNEEKKNKNNRKKEGKKIEREKEVILILFLCQISKLYPFNQFETNTAIFPFCCTELTNPITTWPYQVRTDDL